MGFTKNVVYIGDSRADFFAALNAKVASIWVPSRKLQDVYDVRSQDYVSYIQGLLGNRFYITNDLYSKETLSYINNVLKWV
ncbi:MAG: hypothetical protein ACD_22C00171G0004 [uncultured bacterium]|nr:MAG: hypothetical protein ACD_22C00171G0004 [uncultured bacterium]